MRDIHGECPLLPASIVAWSLDLDLQEMNMPLLKAANGDIPVSETLELMQAHGFDLVSHSRAQVDAAAKRDQMIDVVLHHQSISDQSSEHSCWNRCSVNVHVEAEAEKTERSPNTVVDLGQVTKS
jgi:hypothetical protein